MNNSQAIARSQLSLEGLSIGDAFGEQFFGEENSVLLKIAHRIVPEGQWHVTDDTIMALSIVDTLEAYGEIKQSYLANAFAKRYMKEPDRGYGPSMHRTLEKFFYGEHWLKVSKNNFNGMGSYGNGAAMRVSPIGAYFANNLSKVKEQATLSAEITHAHPEAIAGAIGIAIATALALQWKETKKKANSKEFLETVADWLPESEVKSRVVRASNLGPNTTMMHAVTVLGNGILISAQDTVPLALWCAAQYLDNYPEALWLTVGALGDRDTTCAMVGGIVACYTGLGGIPESWRNSQENLDAFKGANI